MHSLAILFFFLVLAGLATLLERIFRDNLAEIRGALRGPRVAPTKASRPARARLAAR